MITFDPATHTYELDGKKLVSVTQLLRKHGLAPDYSGVSEAVLNAAANRGTMIHEELDTYNKTGEIGFTIECADYVVWLAENGVEPVTSEQIVHNDIVAGTFDVLLRTKDGEKILADFKTTSSLHRDSVAWQLSIYEALLGETVDHLMVFHFADGGLRVVEIPRKPKEEVDRLFACERAGELYRQEITDLVDAHQIAAMEAAEALIAEAEAMKAKAEQTMAEIKTALLSAMEQHGVKTVETGTLKITYVGATEKRIIDTARLKKEQPEIAEQYMKTSTTAANLRITRKEPEE